MTHQADEIGSTSAETGGGGESDSLEAHEAQFGPNGTGEAPEPAEPTADAAPVETTAEQKARDDQGRFQKTPRHRAKSQQASPEDVGRINVLTAKLRAAEERAAAAEARATPPQPAREDRPAGTVPAPGAESGVSRPAVAPSQWGRIDPETGLPENWVPTRPEPTEDDVGTKYATYSAMTKAQTFWAAEQLNAWNKVQQAHDKQQQTYREWDTRYAASRAELVKTTPDYEAVIAQANQTTQAAGIVIPQVLLDAIRSSEHGPRIEYWLATHQPDYHELIRDAWAVNQFSSVGMVRRVLESKLPSVVASTQRPTREAAGLTGAAPTLLVVPAPRPPTPVRTGPLKSSDEPPDDDDGLEAHEAHYYRRT